MRWRRSDYQSYPLYYNNRAKSGPNTPAADKALFGPDYKSLPEAGAGAAPGGAGS